MSSITHPTQYPGIVKVFPIYQDQPLPNDIDYSSVMSEMYQEIVSVENILGVTPFAKIDKYKNFAQALGDLWANFSPSVHSHRHNQMQLEDVGNDHPQYTLVDGSIPFSVPITGQTAVNNNQLVTWGQITGAGYITTTAFLILMNTALTNVVHGSYPYGFGDPGVVLVQGSYGVTEQPPASMPALGSGSFNLQGLTPGWTLAGGTVFAITDNQGGALVSLGHPFNIAIQGIVMMGLPVSVPWDPNVAPHWDPTTTTIEVQAFGFDQLALKFGTTRREVMFSWLAIGM